MAILLHRLVEAAEDGWRAGREARAPRVPERFIQSPSLVDAWLDRYWAGRGERHEQLDLGFDAEEP